MRISKELLDEGLAALARSSNLGACFTVSQAVLYLHEPNSMSQHITEELGHGLGRVMVEQCHRSEAVTRSEHPCLDDDINVEFRAETVVMTPSDKALLSNIFRMLIQEQEFQQQECRP